MREHTKVLIIGSGPAGYTAAIYAARANLEPMLIAGLQPGGQLTITTDVENYPGFADVVQGPWLMEQMQAQAAHVGTEIVNDIVIDIDLEQRPFTAKTDQGKTVTADTVVICTGASARWLGLPSEKKFQSFGVSACATCDGFFYRGKKVSVVGGGNTAVEEALFLTNFAESVTLIHRRDELRAEKIMQDRLFKNPKVNVIWDHVVDEVLGDENTETGAKSVTGLRLKSTKDGTTQEIETDGMFVAIGHDPATKLFKGKLKMDDEGYIITDADSTLTSVPGVYAAGDVRDKVYRQAVTAAGMGCMAALEAERFLAEREDEAAATEAA
ncbi:MAG: thioredoxin-disulfide reductase [Alphaproteobacteria bacterium]|nr:thioredoxin-disulfide reductase [Alphaproteobacteria bacterium SS10]